MTCPGRSHNGHMGSVLLDVGGQALMIMMNYYDRLFCLFLICVFHRHYIDLQCLETLPTLIRCVR